MHFLPLPVFSSPSAAPLLPYGVPLLCHHGPHSLLHLLSPSLCTYSRSFQVKQSLAFDTHCGVLSWNVRGSSRESGERMNEEAIWEWMGERRRGVWLPVGGRKRPLRSSRWASHVSQPVLDSPGRCHGKFGIPPG